MYFKTNDQYVGDEDYFERVFGPIRDFTSGKWNPTFMQTLMKYMLMVDINGWRAEKLIRELNSNVDGGYNEHLERYYAALNPVDRYVVDNYKKFQRGIALDCIKIPGYAGKVSLAKMLMRTCNHTRQRRGAYERNNYCVTEGTSEKVQVYTLKSRIELSEYWAVIDYMNNVSDE